jgi:mycothiol synthase
MTFDVFKTEDIWQLTELIKQECNRDIVNEKIMREKIFEDNDFDPEMTLVAKKNNEIIGFIMGIIRQRDEGKIGYVKLLAVAKNFRRKKIGTGLLKEVENKLKGKGAIKIRLFESYPNYLTPGVDPFYTEAVCFFERNGYVKFNDCSNLLCNLENQSFDTRDEEISLYEKGIKCSRASVDDFDRLKEWMEINFKEWIGEISSAFLNEPPSIHIAEKDGKIIAFSAYETNNKGTGWFGPMGTATEERGLGIGGVLLKRCMSDMKQMGFKTSIIPWTGPIPFYMHYVNSPVYRVFWRYEKILE